MMQWIAEHVFSSLAGWLGITGIIVVGCLAVAWFFPPFRRIALIVAGVALSVATIYAKGNRDRAALERRRKEEAVRRAREKYDEIDKRPDTDDDVTRRLRNNGF